MKAIIILMVLMIGALMFALVVATATPNDKEEYERYMKYKERRRKESE